MKAPVVLLSNTSVYFHINRGTFIFLSMQGLTCTLAVVMASHPLRLNFSHGLKEVKKPNPIFTFVGWNWKTSIIIIRKKKKFPDYSKTSLSRQARGEGLAEVAGILT